MARGKGKGYRKTERARQTAPVSRGSPERGKKVRQGGEEPKAPSWPSNGGAKHWYVVRGKGRANKTKKRAFKRAGAHIELKPGSTKKKDSARGKLGEPIPLEGKPCKVY